MSNPFVNRFWLNTNTSATPTAAQLLALSNAVAAAWRTRILPHLDNNVHVTAQRTVMYVDADTEIGVDGADTGSGGVSGTPYPAESCYLANWSISGTYRGGHPRTYIPGVDAANAGPEGNLVGSFRTSLATDLNNFRTDVNALSPSPFTAVQLGTIRFFRGHAALSPPVFEPFLSGSIHPRLATQRRRQRT